MGAGGDVRHAARITSERGPAPLPSPAGDETPPRLGAILESLGVIGASDALLGRYEQDLGDSRRLGQILISQGLATVEQVTVALEIQRRAATTRAAPLDRAVEQPDPRREAERARRTRNLQSVASFGMAMLGVATVAWLSGGRGSWYGVGALLLLTIKLGASSHYRPATAESGVGSVAVIVSFYNEDPRAFLRCVESILAQTRAADEIWLIDDGSSSDLCARLAIDLLMGRPGATLHRLEHNGGKRHAQGHAFLRTTCDVVVTVDSDTVLAADAVAEGLKPFADPTVHAVAANVRALNHRKNILTRLIDMRYANAFLMDRAAYSVVGSVVCCCGSLSFFRTATVQRHAKDFLSQRFLGVAVQYGDDRRLTQYALTHGRVVFQDTSVGYTLVPENLGHYRRQQLRWNKSFFRESLWAIKRFGVRRWPFWISLVELAVWLIFTASLIRTFYLRPAMTSTLVPWPYVAYAIVLAYARNVRYFGRPGDSRQVQLSTFALAPLYTVLHVVLLTPLRVWALLTLRKTGWGTRRTVEVRAV